MSFGGPQHDAECLAAGGTGSTIAANKAAGDAFEQAVGAELRATHGVVAPQVTIRCRSDGDAPDQGISGISVTGEMLRRA